MWEAHSWALLRCYRIKLISSAFLLKTKEKTNHISLLNVLQKNAGHQISTVASAGHFTSIEKSSFKKAGIDQKGKRNRFCSSLYILNKPHSLLDFKQQSISSQWNILPNCLRTNIISPKLELWKNCPYTTELLPWYSDYSKGTEVYKLFFSCPLSEVQISLAIILLKY